MLSLLINFVSVHFQILVEEQNGCCMLFLSVSAPTYRTSTDVIVPSWKGAKLACP